MRPRILVFHNILYFSSAFNKPIDDFFKYATWGNIKKVTDLRQKNRNQLAVIII